MPTVCLSCREAIAAADYMEHRRGCQDDIAESNRRRRAVEAMRQRWQELHPCTCHSAYTAGQRPDPRCVYHQHVADMDALADSIHPAAANPTEGSAP